MAEPIDARTLIEVLSQIGPGSSAQAASQGFESGRNAQLESRKAAFARKVAEADLFNTKELGTVPKEAGLELAPDRTITGSTLSTLMSARTNAKKAEADKPRPALSADAIMGQISQINEARRNIGLPEIPQSDADAIINTASATDQQKLLDRHARVAGIGTSQYGINTAPVRSAQGAALKDIDAPKSSAKSALEVVANYSPEFVGPVKARVAGAKEVTGLGTPGQKGITGAVTGKESTFRAAITKLKNTDVKEFAGSAVTGSEWERVKAQLPDPNMKPEQFVARFNLAARTFNAIIDNKEKTLNIDLGVERWKEIPEGSTAAVSQGGQTPVARYERGPDGKLKRVQ